MGFEIVDNEVPVNHARARFDSMLKMDEKLAAARVWPADTWPTRPALTPKLTVKETVPWRLYSKSRAIPDRLHRQIGMFAFQGLNTNHFIGAQRCCPLLGAFLGRPVQAIESGVLHRRLWVWFT